MPSYLSSCSVRLERISGKAYLNVSLQYGSSSEEHSLNFVYWKHRSVQNILQSFNEQHILEDLEMLLTKELKNQDSVVAKTLLQDLICDVNQARD